MIFVILVFVIVFLVVFFILATDFVDTDLAAIGALLVGLIFTFFAMVIGGVISHTIESIPNAYTDISEDTQIYSLETNVSVGGNFILGIGGINNDVKYYFYTKDENDLYSIDSIEGKYVKLKLDDTAKPCIRKVRREYNNKILELLFNVPIYREKILVVPSSTIKQTFNGMITK